MKNRLEMVRNIRLELSGVKINKPSNKKFIEPNPCGEEGYVAYGTKILPDGREVPNCIPDPEEMKKVVKEGFPIPSPEGGEDENTFISRCMGELNTEFPDESQRAAVCYKSWREE
jgi:hypothetical protein